MSEKMNERVAHSMGVWNISPKYTFLSGTTLKFIAVISMLLDHIGAVLVYPLYQNHIFANIRLWYYIYYIMRGIGRLAFPIYAFLLVEGFIHTRSKMKYALNLLLFAIISEMPFDLALGHELTHLTDNVFFTLFLALLCIWSIETAQNQLEARFKENTSMQVRLGSYLGVVIVLTAAFASMAYLLDTDYDMFGVILVSVLYLFRYSRLFQGLLGYTCFLKWAWSFPAFFFIQFYNGKRGIGLKYFFYAFYPVHLMILYYISKYLTNLYFGVI